MGAPLEITFPISSKQREFVFDDLSTPFSLFLGGYGSGKTVAMGLRSLLVGWLNAPAPVLFMEPTFSQVEDVAVAMFYEVLEWLGEDPSKCFDWKPYKKKAIVTLDGHTWPIFFRTYDNPKLIAGFNAGSLFCDEFDYCPLDVYRQASQRIRHPRAFRLLQNFATTPEHFGGITHTMFELDPIEGSRMVRSATRDNIFAPRAFIEAQLAQFRTEEERKRYSDGHYIQPGGRVYRHFDETKHVAPCELHASDDFAMSCDFGSHVVAWAFVRRVWNRLHVFDELVLENADTPIAIGHARRKWSEIFTKLYGRAVSADEAVQRVTVYGDPAGGKRFNPSSGGDFYQLHARGFTKQRYRRLHNAVLNRIASVNEKLIKGELLFDPRAEYVL